MRLFPSILANYIDVRIELTEAEQRRIYGCFNDGGLINSMNNFENFAFRHGDKQLLISIAEYIREKVESRCCGENGEFYIKEDYSFFKLCNPNAKLSTISTMLGVFYGVEEEKNKALIGDNDRL